MGTVSKVAKLTPVTGPKANLRERTYTFTAELYHAGQLKVSGCRTLKAGQLLEGLAPDKMWPIEVKLWDGEPPVWWGKMRTKDAESCELRLKVENPDNGVSVGLFVGDVRAGDDESTSFGLRSLPTSLPEDKASDVRIGVDLFHSGWCCCEVLVWDTEANDIVEFGGTPLLKHFADELPWSSELVWHEYESYF